MDKTNKESSVVEKEKVSMSATNSNVDTRNYLNEWIGKIANARATGMNAKEINKALGNVVVDNPDLRNKVLKNLKTMPYLPDRASIETALSNPSSNEKTLRQIGANLFTNSFPMYKLARFYDGILTYRYILIPQSVSPKTMATNRYEEENKFVDQWMKKLNPTYQLRRVVQEVIQSGKRAYCLREFYENVSKEDKEKRTSEGIDTSLDSKSRKIKRVFLQELPDDYIKIVGKSTESYYTVAFNFAYFMTNPEININGYPPFFKKTLDLINSNKKDDSKDKDKIVFDNESIAKIKKKIGNFEYGYQSVSGSANNFYFWANIPPEECQVFSMDESTPIQASNFMGLFLMGGDLQAYNILQQQLTSVPLYSMVVGEMPIDEDARDNPLILSPETVDFFTEMINSLMPDGTTYVMTPSKENKVVQFNEQPNATKVYASALQDMMGTSGVGGLLSTTDKPNLSQIKTSQLTEKRFIDIFYAQFEDFINRRFEKMADSGYLRYDWEVKMYGDIFTDKDREESLLKGMSQGLTFNLPEYLGFRGLTLNDAKSLANQVKASKVYDLIQPLVSAYQQGSNINGETKKDIKDEDVENDNTAISKEAGTNKNEDRIEFERMQKELENLKEMIENDEEGGG